MSLTLLKSVPRQLYPTLANFAFVPPRRFNEARVESSSEIYRFPCMETVSHY